jgi:hypothetical protein
VEDIFILNGFCCWKFKQIAKIQLLFVKGLSPAQMPENKNGGRQSISLQ